MQAIYNVRADSQAVKDTVRLVEVITNTKFSVDFVDDVDAWGAEEHSVVFHSPNGKVFKCTAGLFAAWPQIAINEMKILGLF